MSQASRNSLSLIGERVARFGWRRLFLGLAVGLGGIAVSWSCYWLLLVREQRLASVEFQDEAQGCVAAVEHTVRSRVRTVGTLAAFYASSQSVEREEFNTFSRWLTEPQQGIQSLGWAPLVPAAARSRHELAVRGEGFPQYKITEKDERGRQVAAGVRDEYCPVVYVDSPDQSAPPLGFDLQSDPAFHAAMDKARASGQLAACVWYRSGKKDEVLLYVVAPAKNGPADQKTRSSPRPAANGFVFGVFRIRDIVQTVLGLFPEVGVEVSIEESPPTAAWPFRMRLSARHAHEEAISPAGLSTARRHYAHAPEIAGDRWRLDCYPLQGYWIEQETWGPAAVLLGGLLLTALMVGYLLLFSGRTARVERLVAERTRELGESEQRFRRLVDNAGDAFFLRDAQGKILDVNKRACDSLGYTREELLSMTIADVDVRFVPDNLNRYVRLPAEKYPVTFEGIQRRKDGFTFPVEIRLAPLGVGQQRLFLSLVRDVTDRKRAEEELRKEQRLLREMLDLNERDRKLVAYDIHDGLAQLLTGSLYKFQSIEPLGERDPQAARKLFDEAVQLLREATAETRRLISGLRPPILDESGIVAAIEYLISEQRLQAGPEIEFVRPADVGRLAAPLEGAVFRIVQECLTNACRYSQSAKVRVELKVTETRVSIEVRDWGVGFDAAEVDGGHIGLQGIRQRAYLLGGATAIETGPGKGTRICVELPFLPPLENGNV